MLENCVPAPRAARAASRACARCRAHCACSHFCAARAAPESDEARNDMYEAEFTWARTHLHANASSECKGLTHNTFRTIPQDPSLLSMWCLLRTLGVSLPCKNIANPTAPLQIQHFLPHEFCLRTCRVILNRKHIAIGYCMISFQQRLLLHLRKSWLVHACLCTLSFIFASNCLSIQ